MKAGKNFNVIGVLLIILSLFDWFGTQGNFTCEMIRVFGIFVGLVLIVSIK